MNPRTFLRILLAGGIDCVLVMQLDRPEMTETWRDQFEALRADDRAHLIFDDGESWALKLDLIAVTETDGG